MFTNRRVGVVQRWLLSRWAAGCDGCFTDAGYFRQNPGEETELVERLPQMWEDLVLKSKNIDAGLTRVKKKFTEVRSDALLHATSSRYVCPSQ